ncbi:transcriptional regulator, IclR family [Actinacidiphila yanglinensis]|uniref:Transcriptional regulator, IclR family n=1 Tax=Actinacidiphila yanglinensis TaxID=310779 RepID=A0A1H6DZF3_9ACTN|nr:IclR family transcriptional regulator C-terminal domain-containing protein [Actinacidiphila yanglinensis]SEG90730.1 transcriptional regulator, IclR family [Actinacidiphila yanglinensis]
MPDGIDRDSSVGPLERGLQVLRALTEVPEGRLRASALVKATGLARSPVDRIATTLLRLEYLREEGGDLALAPALLELGTAYLNSSGVPRVLGPLARELADSLDESVSVAVPDGNAARFVVQYTRRRALSVSFRIGDLLPVERCAAGLLFTAGWDEDRFASWRLDSGRDFPALPREHRPRPAESELRRAAAEAGRHGWAVDDQLLEPGLVAVAVPVRDAAGGTVAALSVVSHTSRHAVRELRDFALPRMQATAERMSAALAAATGEPPRRATAADRTSDAKRDLGPEYLQSLARGLSVLAALGTEQGGMTLSAVASCTGLARATARRSLLTLESLGYVGSDAGRFSPLPRVLDLGYPVLSRLTLGEIARPHLIALVRQVGESASVAVLDGHDIRYVGRVAANRIMSVTITLGTRFPAHATSMGRVLLAGLPPDERASWLSAAPLPALTPRTVTDPGRLDRAVRQARDDGFAIADQELEEGLRSIAVPLRAGDGRVVAAVNVSLHAGRTSAEEAREVILPRLREAADAISADIAAVTSAQELPPG